MIRVAGQAAPGNTIPIYDARGGPVQKAHLFVAVMGASSYTYAEVTPDEQLASWIGADVRPFEFLQGTPKLVVPDNAMTLIADPLLILNTPLIEVSQSGKSFSAFPATLF